MATNQANFVNQIYQAALAAGLSDAAARVTAAQAGIESGYGERAPGNNFFAITKGSDWTGPTITRTDKDAKGNPIQQQFRVYSSPSAGLADRIAVMDAKFPGFNTAPTMSDALSSLQNGTIGKYYEAPQASYEKTVAGIDKKYLPAPSADTSATRAISTAAPTDSRAYLGTLQYGNPGGGVGVNADKIDPEFANRLSSLIQAAEKATGEKVSVFEGYRDPARSAQLNADYTGKSVTYDGKTYEPKPGMKGKYQAVGPMVSEHNLGMAADIRAGNNPDKYPSGPAYDYMVAHAAEFGLQNLGASDPAHFQIPTKEFKLAKAGTPLKPFKNYNPDNLVPPADIPTGQTAVASDLSVTPPDGRYTVKAGDSLWRIAHENGTTVADLVKANGLKSSSSVIKPGQVLQLGGGTAAGTLAPAASGNSSASIYDQMPKDASYGIQKPLGATWTPPTESVKIGPAIDERTMALAHPAGDLVDMLKQRVVAPTVAETRNEQQMQRQAVKPQPTRTSTAFVSEDHPTSNKAPDLVDVLKDRAAVVTGAPVPMPGRPASLSATPSQDAPAAPPAAAAPDLLRLPSGKMIAPGSYRSNDGHHNVTVTDDGQGNAVMTKQLHMAEIPGLLDPMREVNSHTIAGAVIRSFIPKVMSDSAANLAKAAPAAAESAKTAVLDAVTKATDSIPGFSNVSSAVGNAFSGLGNIFSGGSKKTTAPVMNATGSPDDRAALAPPIKPVAAAPAFTYQQMIETNPAYTDWLAQQKADAIGTGPGSFGDLQGMLTNVKTVAPPKTVAVQKRTPVAPAMPVAPTLSAPVNAPAQPSVGQSGGSKNAPTVTLASGKSVPVGTMGTSNGGKYVYQVQSDGSVKELNSGRTTAPAAPAQSAPKTRAQQAQQDLRDSGMVDSFGMIR